MLAEEAKKAEMKSFEFSQFHKTPMFIPFVIGMGVLILFVLSLIACICYYCKRVSKYEDKIEYLEEEAKDRDSSINADKDNDSFNAEPSVMPFKSKKESKVVPRPFVDPVGTKEEYGNKGVSKME